MMIKAWIALGLMLGSSVCMSQCMIDTTYSPDQALVQLINHSRDSVKISRLTESTIVDRIAQQNSDLKVLNRKVFNNSLDRISEYLIDVNYVNEFYFQFDHIDLQTVKKLSVLIFSSYISHPFTAKNIMDPVTVGFGVHTTIIKNGVGDYSCYSTLYAIAFNYRPSAAALTSFPNNGSF